jgi:hypothetical protein
LLRIRERGSLPVRTARKDRQARTQSATCAQTAASFAQTFHRVSCHLRQQRADRATSRGVRPIRPDHHASAAIRQVRTGTSCDGHGVSLSRDRILDQRPPSRRGSREPLPPIGVAAARSPTLRRSNAASGSAVTNGRVGRHTARPEPRPLAREIARMCHPAGAAACPIQPVGNGPGGPTTGRRALRGERPSSCWDGEVTNLAGRPARTHVATEERKCTTTDGAGVSPA